MSETKTLKQVKRELLKLEARLTLLEALDKYDDILLKIGLRPQIIKEAREKFTKWENRFNERY